ncbi:hypothetical protein Tco_0917138 [Tanacetum coccineum]
MKNHTHPWCIENHTHPCGESVEVAWCSGGDDVVDVAAGVVAWLRWLVMEEGDDGSGGGWPEFGRSGAGYL